MLSGKIMLIETDCGKELCEIIKFCFAFGGLKTIEILSTIILSRQPYDNFSRFNFSTTFCHI